MTTSEQIGKILRFCGAQHLGWPLRDGDYEFSPEVVAGLSLLPAPSDVELKEAGLPFLRHPSDRRTGPLNSSLFDVMAGCRGSYQYWIALAFVASHLPGETATRP